MAILDLYRRSNRQRFDSCDPVSYGTSFPATQFHFPPPPESTTIKPNGRMIELRSAPLINFLQKTMQFPSVTG